MVGVGSHGAPVGGRVGDHWGTGAERLPSVACQWDGSFLSRVGYGTHGGVMGPMKREHSASERAGGRHLVVVVELRVKNLQLTW